MDVKKVYEENETVKYLVKGVTPAFMNAIRRGVMTATPCLAVDDVQIYENDSPVFDEMLSNRLGLLPIKTDVKTYKAGDTVKLVLEKEGPGVVTSKDIKCTDPKIEIADKKILITKLGKGQNIKLEMTARMGVGEEHVRYQPAIISYNGVIEIDNSEGYDTKAILAEMPKGSVEVKAGKLFFSDQYNAKQQNPHLDILRKHGVKIDMSDSDFILTIESTGQLDAKEAVDSAVAQLVAKLDALEEEIKKL